MALAISANSMSKPIQDFQEAHPKSRMVSKEYFKKIFHDGIHVTSSKWEIPAGYDSMYAVDLKECHAVCAVSRKEGKPHKVAFARYKGQKSDLYEFLKYMERVSEDVNDFVRVYVVSATGKEIDFDFTYKSMKRTIVIYSNNSVENVGFGITKDLKLRIHR